MEHQMELHVHKSDFMLPSASPTSLQYLAAVKMCAAPVTVRKATSTGPKGKLPFYTESSGLVIDEMKAFMQHFRQPLPLTNILALDSHLDPEAKSHILSYETYIQQKLYPAYLATAWIDSPNFNTITYPWYFKNFGFIGGPMHTRAMQSEANAYLRQLYPGSIVTNEQIIFATTKEAIKCMNVLSNKLGEGKYLFGDRPTSVDAVAFGFFAFFLRLPFPDDRIQKHLKSCHNLVRYTETIMRIYVPMDSEELAEQRKEMERWERRRMEAQIEVEAERKDKEQSAEHESEFPSRNKIVFGITSAVLVVAALFHYGIVRLTVRDIPEERFETELPVESKE